MAFEWSQVAAKALDQAKVFVPAAGFTGLILWFAPETWGLKTTQGEVIWAPIVTIFCLISSLMMLVHAYFHPLMEWFSEGQAHRRRRKEALQKLDFLNAEQNAYLGYIKYKDQHQFQGWILDDTLRSLVNMGFVERHEETTDMYARHTVHPKIMRGIPEPTKQQKQLLDHLYKSDPPWTHLAKRL